jgi:hypothetical protein
MFSGRSRRKERGCHHMCHRKGDESKIFEQHINGMRVSKRALEALNAEEFILGHGF